MFALTLDQRRSRQAADAVPDLLRALDATPTVRGFERTVGDEVQALVDDPVAAVDVVVLVARTQRWWIGIGVGDVETPVPTSVRAARGPALYAARTAVERAARCPAGVALDVGTGRDEEVDVLERHATQRAAAQELGITPQAMSARLQVARRDDEQRLRHLAARLLVRADDAAT
jgi:hypothetical protein